MWITEQSREPLQVAVLCKIKSGFIKLANIKDIYPNIVVHLKESGVIMKRYILYLQNGTNIKLYGNAECLKHQFPEALKICEDTDLSFYGFVEKIKKSSTETVFDIKGRQIWKIPYNTGYIMYRQFMDEVDGSLLDGCLYQRFDNVGTTFPVLKTLSTPKEFYELFIANKWQSDGELAMVSPKYLQKQKAKMIYNKNNYRFWQDKNGKFYVANKSGLISKRDKDEYMRFHDNNDAVFVSFGKEVAFKRLQWFSNIDEFLEMFYPLKEQDNSMYYEILKRGYKKLPPEERKLIISLPEFDLEREIFLAKSTTANEHNLVKKILNTWVGKNLDGEIKAMLEELISVHLN